MSSMSWGNSAVQQKAKNVVKFSARRYQATIIDLLEWQLPKRYEKRKDTCAGEQPSAALNRSMKAIELLWLRSGSHKQKKLRGELKPEQFWVRSQSIPQHRNHPPTDTQSLLRYHPLIPKEKKSFRQLLQWNASVGLKFVLLVGVFT